MPTMNMRFGIMRSSKMVSLGPNIIVNSDWSLNPINAAQKTTQNGWYWWDEGTFTGTPNWVSPGVYLAGDFTNAQWLEQPLTGLTVGGKYQITVDMVTNASVVEITTGQYGTGTTVLNWTPGGVASNQSNTFTASADTLYVSFHRQNGSTSLVRNPRVQLLS